MTLREQLAPPSARGGTCSVRIFVSQHDKAAEWIELLDDASVLSSQLHSLMRAHGFPAGQQTVQRHRRGECRCGKPAG